MPHFDNTINIGHLLTIVITLAAIGAWLLHFRDRQRLHDAQIQAIQKWIAEHEEELKINLVVFQELRTSVATTTRVLESLADRLERIEDRQVRLELRG